MSAYYERERFNILASYNYRDDYAEGEQSTGQTVYTDGFGQIDLNASFNVTGELTLNAAVINLTKEASSQYWGTEDRLYSKSYSGRRFYMGINYRF